MADTKIYVLKWNKNEGTYAQPKDAGKYAKFDAASGGYPWATDNFLGATLFQEDGRGIALERIANILKMFPYFDVFEIEMKMTKVDMYTKGKIDAIY